MLAGVLAPVGSEGDVLMNGARAAIDSEAGGCGAIGTCGGGGGGGGGGDGSGGGNTGTCVTWTGEGSIRDANRTDSRISTLN